MADATWELQHARSCITAARSAGDEELREENEQQALDHLIEAIEDLLRRVRVLEGAPT